MTPALAKVVRLLNWQVTHHAAVKSTKTMRPSERSSAARAGLHACHTAAFAAAAAPCAVSSARSPGNVHAKASPSTPSEATRKPRLATRPKACEPQAQATKDSATRLPSKAAAPSMPVCCPSTQTSQTTVANIGKAISTLKCAIHAPGRGKARAAAGQALASR